MQKQAAAGFSRRELWVDARDLQRGQGEDQLSAEEYAAVLANRGREKLAEHRPSRSFSVTVRMVNPTYQYGRDFFLGDTITVTDQRLGVTASAVVTGAQRFISRGEQGMSLTLGFGQPSLYEKLRRKEDK